MSTESVLRNIWRVLMVWQWFRRPDPDKTKEEDKEEDL